MAVPKPGGWPMLYGTVVRAELPKGAPHWKIRIRPAINLEELQNVEV
ncbi:MAG: hypothetical protein CM1200mP2_39970 [Planctomycetaceae bacterium]|nr:MAG: hypothetical protein CM1200mP2_39970 [Planctomycetaceae bacterium]